MRKRLVLFDIDGTLVRDDGAAREAYSLALQSVFQYAGSLKPYDFSGRTDPEITYMVLEDAGWSRADIERRFPELWAIYLRELETRASADRVHLLSGVVALLDRLAAIPGATLALLTGNIEPGARIKLAAHELNDYFPFGAFGSDHAVRSELPPIAVARARALTGSDFSAADVVIIGDSIYDVRCGVPHRATTIAVASGRTPVSVLEKEEPDHLFEALDDTDALVTAILGA